MKTPHIEKRWQAQAPLTELLRTPRSTSHDLAQALGSQGGGETTDRIQVCEQLQGLKTVVTVS